MNDVECLDMTNGRTFVKEFSDLREQRNFLIKCRHSKKLLVLSYTYNDQDEKEYLER